MLPNEELHAEMQRLKAENFHLRNQLRNKNDQIKRHVKDKRVMAKRLAEHEKNRKPHFKNGKRGTFKNGG